MVGDTSARRFAAGLFAAAFAIRLLWILVADTTPVSDMRFYFDQGVSIAEGTGYVSNGAVNGYQYPDYPAGAPTADRPVGYSGFLGILFMLFGPSVLVGQLANVCLSASVVVLAFAIARRLGATFWIAGASAVVLVFFPNQIAYCGLLSDSILFQFLVMLGFYLVLRSPRWPWVVATGVVFGLATLTRGYALLLPFLWGWIVWRGLGRRAMAGRFAVVCLVIGAVVAPWSLRNSRAFGEFALVSTNLGHNLLAGHGDDSKGQWEPRLPPAAYAPGFCNEVERDRALRRMALDYMIAHPARTIAMALPKIFYMYADDADGLRWTIKGRPPAILDGVDSQRQKPARYRTGDLAGMAVFEIYYLVVVLGFSAALAFRPRRTLREVDPRGLGLSTIVYFTMIAVVFCGMPRFHYPIVPVLTIYATSFLMSGDWLPKRWGRYVQTTRDSDTAHLPR